MHISKIDKNFDINNTIPEKDVVWYDASKEPFTLYGGFYDEKGYYRMPRDIAATVSAGVNFLSTVEAILVAAPLPAPAFSTITVKA